MKIGYITPFPPSEDGIANYSANITDIVAQYNSIEDIQIYSFKRNGFRATEIPANQHNLMSFSRGDWKEMKRHIIDQKLDIIHVQFDISNFMLLIFPLYFILLSLKSKTNIKLIATYHEAYRDRDLYGIASIIFYKIFSRLFDRIYAHTLISKQCLINVYKIPEDKIMHMPHGTVNFASKRKNHVELRKRYDLGDRPVVLNFGFIYRTKGIEYLIDAAANLKTLKRKLPIYVIAGQVPKREGLLKPFQKRNEAYLSKLKLKIEEYGLENDFRFIGYVPSEDVYSLFTLAEMVVLPYTSIDQSAVLNTAVSAHTPIIASDIGGLSETLLETGVLAPPRDSDALSKEIGYLLDNNKARLNLKKKYESLSKTLSSKHVVNSMIKDYKRLSTQNNVLLKKILYISIDSAWGKSGAANTHTYSLARSMGKLGHKVYVITNGKGSPIDEGNVTYIRIPLYVVSGNILEQVVKMYLNNWRIVKASLGIQFDVIYERYNIGIFAGLIVKLIKRRRLVSEVNILSADEIIESHHINNSLLQKCMHLISSFQLSHTKHILVQTDELKNALHEMYNLTNVTVVSNGVEMSDPSQLHEVRHNPKFIYVGTIDQYHPLDEILKTFSLLNTIELVVVGGGSKLNEYKRIYSKSKNIKLLGMLPHADALKHIKSSSVGLAQYNLSSRIFDKHGFYFCPLKLLEYSSNGLPSIIIGNSNSIIKKFEDVNACIVLDSSLELKDAVIGLYNSPEQVHSMSINAKQVAKKYSWDKAARNTIQKLYA
jgi:glycosyltransferase involved in cell wall biosynthesis